MNLSYWEYKTWLSNTDFTIVGSGIVGLNCALHLKQRFPEAKILVLEKGFLPQGASTKNAGFACFGSLSEIISDLKHHSEEEVFGLVQKRWNGIQLLRRTLGDKVLDFQQLGGHELFLEKDVPLFQACRNKRDEINRLLHPVFGNDAFHEHPNTFHFKNIQDKYITNTLEAQLDTGKMMAQLLRLVQNQGIIVLNGISVQDFSDDTSHIAVSTDRFEFKTKKLLIATNGFASQLLNERIKPARAQVLITKPIQNLSIKGTFHFDEGYYYFRNIDDRILLGGGRNLDLKTEETTVFEQTEHIQTELEKLLKEVILPDTPFQIDRRWSGIMGVGDQKRPIVKQISEHVFCGVRLGGMGIAIGSLVGKELADLV
ncbi:Glycine/D-amino acid oxidase [Pricia antarctica]|uniref:Glycine/D-amino acid oxidase n=1 Tax=Pricia antarctica TaxID=641691 RepID=A0A1G7HCJ2_9FLAO|nr:FAD-binding oxidoreductase [Pricia antarctica]SDE98024.1 Glycine/D-amino acid oxidase [Pricia antarctica]